MRLFKYKHFEHKRIVPRDGDHYYGCMFINCSIVLPAGVEKVIVTNCIFQGEYDPKRAAHVKLCKRIAAGKEIITEKMLQRVTDPAWKQELVKAICLRQVRGKK